MAHRCAGAAGVLLLFGLVGAGRAGDVPEKYRPVCDKGLAWLARQQHRDGHWEGPGGQFPVALTALSGSAFLLEGSTAAKGRYADNVRRAADWLTERAEPNGLLGNPRDQAEAVRYTLGHAYALLFLSQVYGAEEADTPRRKKLEGVLQRAVAFSAKAQTTRGGWGYVRADEGNDFDEGCCTYAQFHGLLAARSAGVVVPKDVLTSAVGYLKKSQTADGGVVYSLANGGAGVSRPALSAAALSAALAGAEADGEVTRKLAKYCQATFPLDKAARQTPYDTYTQYYLAQAVSRLGEDGFAKLVPGTRPDEGLTWGRYRAAVFADLAQRQKEDGSWEDRYVGAVFATACALTVLQQDRR
jgi:hypothetical protein